MISLFLESNMEKYGDIHKTEEIANYFKRKFNEEDVNKIKQFYFNEHNLENETTKLENICRVSIIISS